MVGPSGVSEYRFRFSDAPNLNYSDGIPAIKNFYMKKGSNTWHMNTSDHVFDSGTVPSALTTTTTAVTTPTDGPATWTVPNNTTWLNTSSVWKGIDDYYGIGWTDGQVEALGLEIYDMLGVTLTASGSNFVLTAPSNTIGSGGSTTTTQTIVSKNQIQLASSASSTNDAYNGLEIEVLTKDATNNVTKQVRLIEDYNGSTKIATISDTWDSGDEPKINSGTTTTYKIFSTTRIVSSILVVLSSVRSIDE